MAQVVSFQNINVPLFAVNCSIFILSTIRLDVKLDILRTGLKREKFRKGKLTDRQAIFLNSDS